MSALVWYVSYGSNMCRARFECYLSGGTPHGATRRYTGCRDNSPPRGSAPVWLPGQVYFAGRSATWGGGMAFYDPDADGRAPGRGYLITAEQFADVHAQEMHRPVGGGLDVAAAVAARRLMLGTGRYETLVHLGDRDGAPMLTFTAARRVLPPNEPVPAYAATIAAGLVETFGWSPRRATTYYA